MVPAAAALPPSDFDSTTPPAPGDPVPADCVWARHPHPGAVRYRVSGQPHKRLEQLGTLVGRTHGEIVQLVGPPAATQDLLDGLRLVSWQGKEFWTSATVTVSLLFDRYAVCAGMSEQTASGPALGFGFLVGTD